MDSLSTASKTIVCFKLESARKLGTHRARHVVDTKGKMFCGRIFIHNIFLAIAKKKPPKLWRASARELGS